MVLEDTGVSAYNGQGTAPAPQDAAGRGRAIVSVEARHAAWIRYLVGQPGYGGDAANYPAPAALDRALSKRQVEAAVAATGFIKG